MLKLMTCKRISHAGLYDAYVHDGGKINVSRAGGGPVIATFATQASFLAEFVPAEPDLTLRKGTVTAEFLPEMEFPCFTTEERWNGFAMPRFDLRTTNQLVELFTAGATGGQPPSLRWLDGVLQQYDWSDLAYFALPFTDEVINGATVRLWSVGDGWCWDAVEFPAEVQTA